MPIVPEEDPRYQLSINERVPRKPGRHFSSFETHCLEALVVVAGSQQKERKKKNEWRNIIGRV